jgi:signal transduction histidine kinase
VSNPISPDRGLAAEGHGIVGMRERAALVGGSFEAGAADGVFRIRAELPYGVGGE